MRGYSIAYQLIWWVVTNWNTPRGVSYSYVYDHDLSCFLIGKVKFISVTLVYKKRTENENSWVCLNRE